MNICEYLKKSGWQIEVDKLKRCSSVDICFVNSEGLEDETEFDIYYAATKEGEKELSKLYTDFCKENGFKTNTVLSVSVVRSADTMEELETLETLENFNNQEIELAFSIGNRYITIQETSNGYDYSIMDESYRELDGGVYDDPDISIREALGIIVEDELRHPKHVSIVCGNVKPDDELIELDYDTIEEKIEEANRIIPEIE